MASSKTSIRTGEVDAADPFDQAVLHAARVAAEIPDHRVLPSDLTSRLALRLVALIDTRRGREDADNLLRRHLAQLPWDVTAALLHRTDAGARGQWFTTQILAASRDPRVTSRLISLLDDEAGPVGTVFAVLHDQDAECYVEEMLRRFTDPKQRHYASTVLQSYTTSPRVLDALLPFAADPDPAVRQEALHALKRRRENKMSAIWRAAIAADDDSVRHLAVAGLAEAHMPGSAEMLAQLIDHPDPVVVVFATGKALDSESVEKIIQFTQHQTAHIRSSAASALARHGAMAQATAALISLAGDAQAFVRFRAADALAQHQTDEATATLIGLLDDHQEVAARAAESLREHDRPAVASLVLGWLGPDPEPARLTLAISALQGLSAPEAGASLRASLTAGPAEVRLAAAQALTGARGGSTASALVPLLADPAPEVRQAVIQALAPAHFPDAMAAIATLLADPAPEVRAAAVTALPLSDRSPHLIAPILSLLADDVTEVREAVVRQIEQTTAPSVLRWICVSSLDLSDLLATSRKAISDLADRVYRGLSADEQITATRRLCAASAGTTLAARSTTPEAGGRSTEPPQPYSDELLGTPVIMLLQGNNLFGNRVYSYIELPGRRLMCLFDAMQTGQNFKPTEYGAVIAAGVGEPPPDVRETMQTAFNMTEVPIPIPVVHND